MSSLYEITGQYMAVRELLEDPDVTEDEIRDTLNGIEGAFEDKADSYAKLIREMNLEADMVGKEIDRLTLRKQTLQSRAKYLKDYLEDAMRAVGKTKFKTALFSFGIQKNGGIAPLTVDYEKVPAEFLIPQPPKVDNEKVRELLKTSEVDWARLEPRGESLRIR